MQHPWPFTRPLATNTAVDGPISLKPGDARGDRAYLQLASARQAAAVIECLHGIQARGAAGPPRAAPPHPRRLRLPPRCPPWSAQDRLAPPNTAPPAAVALLQVSGHRLQVTPQEHHVDALRRRHPQEAEEAQQLLERLAAAPEAAEAAQQLLERLAAAPEAAGAHPAVALPAEAAAHVVLEQPLLPPQPGAPAAGHAPSLPPMSPRRGASGEPHQAPHQSLQRRPPARHRDAPRSPRRDASPSPRRGTREAPRPAPLRLSPLPPGEPEPRFAPVLLRDARGGSDLCLTTAAVRIGVAPVRDAGETLRELRRMVEDTGGTGEAGAGWREGAGAAAAARAASWPTQWMQAAP